MTTDTAPIRPEERFDEERVARHLRSHLPGLVGDGPITFSQFPGGKANLTYQVTAGATELVLRRPPLGPVAPGSHDMGREFRVLNVLHTAYPPAPRAYLFCDDPGVMDKPFFVMERRRGFVVRADWPDALDPSPGFRRGVAERLVDRLADLHMVDFAALGLGGLGRPEGFAARQVGGWTDRWERSRSGAIPEMEELARRLAARVPVPQRAVLLHNDFKLDNTMLDDRGEVVAVFDWDMSTLGDPLVDLGTTLSYWGGGGGVADLVAADSMALGDVMDVGSVAERYATRTGLDLGDVDWYRALGMFRIAVIVQQIYVRFLRGQTSDERFAGLGAVVAPLAAAGLELVKG
ncbi:MAG TPA: phosphotransferase family protein [Acidimicrobiia bacterium]|nr:phosphotransferase family protein [Acidimicrobiia bacterium]